MNVLFHVTSFLALILGLAIANVLTNLAGLFKQRDQVRWYWIHSLWVFALIVAIALEWWVVLNWAKVERISFPLFLFLLIKPTILFFGSDLLFPEKESPYATDLKAHFYSVRRLMAVTSFYLPVDVIDSLLKGVDHFQSLGGAPYAQLVLWLIITAASRSTNERVHAFAAISFAIALVWAGFFVVPYLSAVNSLR
jgi:hypothetical protein